MSGQPDLDLLRRLWWFSMHDSMPIWVAGQLQAIVIEKVGAESATEVDRVLGTVPVSLTAAEVEEIRERNRRIVDGKERI